MFTITLWRMYYSWLLITLHLTDGNSNACGGYMTCSRTQSQEEQNSYPSFLNSKFTMLSSTLHCRLDTSISKTGKKWVIHQEIETKTVYNFWKWAIPKSHLEFDFGNHCAFLYKKMAKSQASGGQVIVVVVSCLCSTGDQTQYLTHGRQAPYHWATSPAWQVII